MTDGVPWVTGRRRAIVRSIAVLLAESHGDEWAALGLAAQKRWVDAVESRVSNWIKRGVLAEFVHPYAGEPVPDTEPATDAAKDPQEAPPKARRARR